jgi:uncharacterized membrane protein YtjA (UPF0391 family)
MHRRVLSVVAEKNTYGQEASMLQWALIFLVVALVAGVLGFGGVAIISVDIARILFFIFLVLFVVSLIAGLLRGRPTI